MIQCRGLNSVFLPHEDEKKKFKPILLSGPPSYNPKVMIHDWQFHSLTEPRDNKTGHPGKSTYKRFGTDDSPTGISVTRAMTEQVHTQGDYVEEFRHRSLLNFYSFPYTETLEYQKSLNLTDLIPLKPTEYIDYRSTFKHDFPSHFPHAKPKIINIPDKPWLMYRRTLGYSNDDLERRPGIRKFLDDDMETHQCAAAIKMRNHLSYDPILNTYTDPTKCVKKIVENSILMGQ